MSQDSIEPLEPGIWLLQLRKLAERTPAEEAGLAMALRRAFHLVQLTPRPLRHIIACTASEPEFEGLLQAGALLAAAQALVGDRLEHSLTTLPAEGGSQAEVRFPNDPAPCRAVGSSAPFALFSAWLKCLLTLHEPDEFGQEWVRSPSQRKSLSGRRPKLTEH